MTSQNKISTSESQSSALSKSKRHSLTATSAASSSSRSSRASSISSLAHKQHQSSGTGSANLSGQASGLDRRSSSAHLSTGGSLDPDSNSHASLAHPQSGLCTIERLKIQDIRQDGSSEVITIQPDSERGAAQLNLRDRRVHGLSFNLRYFYKDWDTKAHVKTKLLKNARVRCDWRVTVSGQVEVVYLSWPKEGFHEIAADYAWGLLGWTQDVAWLVKERAKQELARRSTHRSLSDRP